MPFSVKQILIDRTRQNVVLGNLYNSGKRQVIPQVITFLEFPVFLDFWQADGAETPRCCLLTKHKHYQINNYKKKKKKKKKIPELPNKNPVRLKTNIILT
jgi:hypothetical protein